MTKEMREFLTAWLSWAEGGACKDHEYGNIFRPYTGLCAALDYWTDVVDVPFYRLIEELGGMLGSGGLDTEYPFDTEESYSKAARLGTHHLNPARLAWVRSKLESKDA